MADDEKNEEIEDPTETPAEETPVAEEPEAAAEPEVEATPEVVAEAPAEEPAAEAPAEESPAAPDDVVAPPAQVQGKKQRKLKHVPRSKRRTRSKTVSKRAVREPASPRKAIVRIPKPESERNARQERRGVVVSDKGDKTIIVKVDVQKIHPKYKKVVRSTTRFHAHDEANTAGVGDTVRIVETRPLSKLKHWRLAEIVEKAK